MKLKKCSKCGNKDIHVSCSKVTGNCFYYQAYCPDCMHTEPGSIHEKDAI